MKNMNRNDEESLHPIKFRTICFQQGRARDRLRLFMTHWTHILTLLSYAVLIDRRVYKEEVDCFVEQALALQKLLTPDMLFSKKMAFDWFMAHRDEKMEQLNSDKYELYILESVIALTDFKGHEHILSAMNEISQSDGEYHDNEVNLISLAKTHWRV